MYSTWTADGSDGTGEGSAIGRRVKACIDSGREEAEELIFCRFGGRAFVMAKSKIFLPHKKLSRSRKALFCLRCRLYIEAIVGL